LPELVQIAHPLVQQLILSGITVGILGVSYYGLSTYLGSASLLCNRELAKVGVSEEMVRLSVGIEHIDDTISDIKQSLAVAK